MAETSLRILLVEDEPAHAEAIRRAFLAAGPGAVIQVAGTLREYRELAAAAPPDIAIMDLKLPDGQAVEILTSPPEAGPFPILVMSSYGDEQVAVKAMKAGALDYVVKSSDAFAAMPRTVERALREWQLRQERKRAEEALRRAEENFRHSLDDSPLGVRIVTAEGETIYANRAILDIYGFRSLEELRTTPVEKRYTPESYAEFKKRYERKRRGEDSPSEYEVSIVRKNGEVRHLQVSRKELLWSGKKQYQTIYRDITERKQAEEELRASLREKEVLLREIHHRVKNNMQVISSLFNLQAGHTTNEECRGILKEGQMRIRSMSLVHEKLYQSRDLSKIDFAGYIQSLAVHLLHVYLVNPAQVRMETDFEDVSLDINSAVPCGLILNELVSNALKHAFPEGRTGVIKIGLRRGPGGAVELRVADDGVGLPKGLDFRKAESFGLQIVNLLVDQLEAAIDLDRTKGTAFTMTFRELKYAPRT